MNLGVSRSAMGRSCRSQLESLSIDYHGDSILSSWLDAMEIRSHNPAQDMVLLAAPTYKLVRIQLSLH